MDEIRILTLWQPWAQLVADKRKHYETRSWGTNYRGWLAIHAAKAFPREARLQARGRFGYDVAELRFGVILCLARLTDVVETSMTVFDPDDLPYGDFSDGRYAWKLDDVRKLREPFRWTGGQGLRRLGAPTVEKLLERVSVS